MSLNNNQEDNNHSFGNEFSEEMENNFDNDPSTVAATKAISPKSKGGWLMLLVGIIGTGAYLGYRYYLVPNDTSVASIEETALNDIQINNNRSRVPTMPAAPTTVSVSTPVNNTETDKATRQAHKNVQFEHLKNYLFDHVGETTQRITAVTVPPPASNATPAPSVLTPTAGATPPAAAKNEAVASVTPSPSAPAQAVTQNPIAMNDAIRQVTHLNERLENHINQIQHLEDALQSITQTIAKLNTDISAMDNRLLALSNSTGNLSSDMGTVKHDMSNMKRVLGEDNMRDIGIPPPPSHTYLKASQVASARPQAAIPAYVVHAIIPGRAWLKSNHGQIMTVTEGDTLGDYGKVLVIDAASGMVLTSSGNTFQ